MMIFPFTIKYKSGIYSNFSINESWNLIENEFKARKAEIIESTDYKLTFKIRLFSGVSNWSLMAPIDNGHFLIVDTNVDRKLEYKISLVRLILITAIMSIFFGLISGKILVGFFFFAWLGGANWLIAVIRHYFFFNRLKKIIKTCYNKGEHS